MRRMLSLMVFMAIFLSACNKKNYNTRLPEDMPPPVLPYSQWNVPISIPLDELNRSINFVLVQNFSEGFTIDDRYKITTTLAGEVRFQASDKSLYCDIPLRLDILPAGGFSQIKANGELELQLRIDLDIFQNNLMSRSEIYHHRWIKTPVINFFGIKIPFSQIADKIINKYKSRIAVIIDDYIKNEINLSKFKNSINSYLSQGLVETEDKIIQLFAGIQEIGLSPMKIQQNELLIPLSIFFESVLAESKPADLYNDLQFSMRPAMDAQSIFTIQSRIPLAYLEQLLREQIENQEFSTGFSKLYINKISLSGHQENFFINLETQKAFNGKLQIKFVPNFDNASKKIQLDQFTISALEGKKIEKTVLQWFNGFISQKVKKQMENQMNDFLQKYVSYLQQLIKGTSLWQGSTLSGELLDYSINQFSVFDNRMYFSIHTRLTSQLRIDRMYPEKISFK